MPHRTTFSPLIQCSPITRARWVLYLMEDHRSKHELLELSQLGHFLKGSSATLGLTKIKDACEKIQHYGAGKDVSGMIDEPNEAKSLSNIKKTLVEVKEAYNEVVKLLKRYYGDTTSS